MSALSNLGFIAKAAYYPCNRPDPFLILQAGADALFPVLLNAVTFSCLDIIKMRAGISPWHARGMKALIGGAIPGEQSGVAKDLLKFTIPLEKALFFFFVVDLTIDFFARWQSLIFKLNACANNPNNCATWGTRPIWIGYPVKTWNPVEFLDTQENGFCHFTIRDRIVVPPGAFWSLFFSLQVKEIFNQVPTATIMTRVIRLSPNVVEFPASESAPAWFGNDFRASDQRNGQNKLGVSEVIAMQAYTDTPQGASEGSCSASISNLPIQEESIIPVNCLGNPAPRVPG
jgi:hypothetical protein